MYEVNPCAIISRAEAFRYFGYYAIREEAYSSTEMETRAWTDNFFLTELRIERLRIVNDVIVVEEAI